MNDLRPSYLNAEWTVEDARCYVSPDLDKDQLEQIVLFDDEIANGSIEAAVTALDGLPDEYPAGRIEATILFRYKQHATCYCAGLGAYGNKYFIARVSHLHEKRQKLELLAAVGKAPPCAFEESARSPIVCESNSWVDRSPSSKTRFRYFPRKMKRTKQGVGA